MKPSAVDENVALTRGYNMAFGVMSKRLYEILFPDIYETLNKNAVPKGKDSDDAETRKFAARSLIQAMAVVGLHNLPLALVEESLETFYRGMNDYQIDRRGDVGSWVREEAMAALKELIYLLYSTPASDETLRPRY